MVPEELRSLAIFDGLSDDRLNALIEAGSEVVFGPGEDLWHHGEPADHWWVVIEGTLDLVRRVGREETVVGRFDVPGRWAGGFRAWDAEGVYLATGRTTSSGRILRVPAPALRELMTSYPLVAHFVDGLFHTARNIEAGVRQREALVALGTLSAGLAHELNNPASAAVRAVSALQTATDDLLSSLGRLALAGISADGFHALDALRQDLESSSGVVDALAVADREEAMSDWLQAHGVGRDWLLAPPLAAAGADVAWCERAAALLTGPLLEPGVEWVASTVSVNALIAQVRDSTRRISDLVGAVKSYSQMDRASQQVADVTEGIESTLLMLGHKIPDAVTVVRDYGPAVPPVEAYIGELNQVWTNLIDNALDAMDGIGTLSVTTRADGDHVVVEIGDTGPGMPTEVAARAFEAFYTTKDVGKGTGLGLDIARRIVVERHGGVISIDSHPGRTILRVSLPARSAA